MRLIAMLSMAGSLIAFGAAAQEVEADIDTNEDGVYSVEELQTVHPDLDEETFTLADDNGDGFLDAAEYEGALTDAEINPPTDDDDDDS